MALDQARDGVCHEGDGVWRGEMRGAGVPREIDDEEVVGGEEGDDVDPFEVGGGYAVEEDEGCGLGGVEGEEEWFFFF